MNRPITCNEIETPIQHLPTNKSPGPDGLTGKFCQASSKELPPIQSFSDSYKILQKKENSQGYSMRSPSH